MKIKKGFVMREVGGEIVIVPVGAMSKQFHGMINLNQTGAFLWGYYQEEHTIEDGVKALLAEYEVDEKIARSDVTRFVETLTKSGFAE